MISNHKNKRKLSMKDYSITKTEQDFLSTMMNTEPELEETTPPKKRSSFTTVHTIPQDNGDKPAKRVTFEDNGNGSNSTSPASDRANEPLQLTEELRRELWYSAEEITKYKVDAKNTVLHREKATDDSLLGLEKFCCQRATWKRSAIHYVLLAQKQKQGEEFVARVSKRCTGWARETALRQGFKDYCAVEDPLASLFGCDEKNYNDIFFNNPVCTTSRNSNSNSNENEYSNKRKAEIEEMTASANSTPDRNVRQKTAASVEDDSSDCEELLAECPAL